jgi:hypothetical protein
MARARVTLLENGPVSFEGQGKKLKRGESLILTLESEILYFQRQQGFSVEFLEGTPSRAVKASEASAEFTPASPKPKGKKKTESEPPPPPEPEEPADGKYTESNLEGLKLSALNEILDEMGYEAAPANTSKDEVVAMILKAQADEG